MGLLFVYMGPPERKPVLPRYGVFVIYPGVDFVDAGGLMAYGLNPAELWRRATVNVDKILKGARPGDLPVEQPTKFELAINLEAAKAIGLTIPPALVRRADRVVE